MRSVQTPVITLDESELAGDALPKFYRALGWNGEDMLDPKKIRTTKAVYERIHAIMLEKIPPGTDPAGVGMLMVNYGPSVDDNIPEGKVHLYKGWTFPEKA